MKRILIILVVVAVVCVAGFAGFYFIRDGGNDKGVEVPDEVPEFNYAQGDTTPEHLAEVLGSQERYEEILGSNLRVETKPMQIVFDVRTNHGDTQKVFWVLLVMEGEIVKIDVERREIIITKEGDAISLYVPTFAKIYRGETFAGVEIDFGQLKEGDYVWHSNILINEKQAQARVIWVAGR